MRSPQELLKQLFSGQYLKTAECLEKNPAFQKFRAGVSSGFKFEEQKEKYHLVLAWLRRVQKRLKFKEENQSGISDSINSSTSSLSEKELKWIRVSLVSPDAHTPRTRAVARVEGIQSISLLELQSVMEQVSQSLPFSVLTSEEVSAYSTIELELAELKLMQDRQWKALQTQAFLSWLLKAMGDVSWPWFRVAAEKQLLVEFQLQVLQELQDDHAAALNMATAQKDVAHQQSEVAKFATAQAARYQKTIDDMEQRASEARETRSVFSDGSMMSFGSIAAQSVAGEQYPFPPISKEMALVALKELTPLLPPFTSAVIAKLLYWFQDKDTNHRDFANVQAFFTKFLMQVPPFHRRVLQQANFTQLPSELRSELDLLCKNQSLSTKFSANEGEFIFRLGAVFAAGYFVQQHNSGLVYSKLQAVVEAAQQRMVRKPALAAAVAVQSVVFGATKEGKAEEAQQFATSPNGNGSATSSVGYDEQRMGRRSHEAANGGNQLVSPARRHKENPATDTLSTPPHTSATGASTGVTPHLAALGMGGSQ